MTEGSTPLGFVATEGGPVVLMDAGVAASWAGIDGADYDRACALLDDDQHADGAEIPIDGGSGVLWEMRGPGVARVFRIRDGFVVVRWWGPSPDKEIDSSLLEVPAEERKQLGKLNLRSSRLLVLWAPENGSEIAGLPRPPIGPARGDLSVEEAGLVVACEPGCFDVVHDTFETADGSGRRCWVLRQAD